MELVEVRRLTGPNLLLAGPAAVADVATDPGDDIEDAQRRLHTRVGAYRAALVAASADCPDWRRASRRGAGRRWADGAGFTLAWRAPVDLLDTMCELVEAAWDDVVAGVTATPVDAGRINQLVESADKERDAALLRMLAAAAEHGVAGVWDDDEVSVGLGRGSRAWSRSEVPDPDTVPWEELHDVPVAMVTGTNGKSTTVRMLDAILRAAGHVPGHSSTDGIVVAGELVAEGDWAGPGGGRTVARHPQVDAIVLETARGGMLRRGLPLERADVAVVTNVADDHLGEYGIATVDELAEVKLTVARAVSDAGVLVLNAENELLVRHAPTDQRTWWFAVDPSTPRLQEAVAGWTVADGHLVRRGNDGDTPLVAVKEVPATFGGAARHNVSNALAAAAVAAAMGVGEASIAAGLRGFVPDAQHNTGRANRYQVDGVTVVVDFAHNPHGVEAIARFAAELDGDRTLVLFSQAGDRSDDELDALAGAVHATGPDRYLTAEIGGYLRGRRPMEVPGRLADALHRRGVRTDDVEVVPDAIEGVRRALSWARPGDVLLILALEHRDQVHDLLVGRGATVG